MNIDQRLHHAARELRELNIEPPLLDLGAVPLARAAPHRRIPALVAPMLFVLGGLVMVAGELRPDTARVDEPAPAPTTVTKPTPDAVDASSIPVRTTPTDELRMIAELVADIGPDLAPDQDQADSAVPPPVVRPGPIGAI